MLRTGAQAAEHEAVGDPCRLELVEDPADIVDPPGLVRAFVGHQLGSFPPASPIPGRSTRTVGIPRAAQRRATSTQARLGPVCGSAPELSRSKASGAGPADESRETIPNTSPWRAGAPERTLDHPASDLQLAYLAHSRGRPAPKRRPGLGHRERLRQPVQQVCDGRLRRLRLLGFDHQSVVVARSESRHLERRCARGCPAAAGRPAGRRGLAAAPGADDNRGVRGNSAAAR